MGHGAQSDLASMMATLEIYDNMFGPKHPQTLFLGLDIAVAYWRVGQRSRAQMILDRVVRNIGNPHSNSLLKLKAASVHRDFMLQQREHSQAAAIQQEIVNDMIRARGADDPETVAARDKLASILLSSVDDETSSPV